MRILLIDIEASDLCAESEILFCVGMKWLGEKTVHLAKLRSDPKAFDRVDLDDSHVLEEVRPFIEKADLLVFHYGDRFDYPFLNARTLITKTEPFPKVPTVDTWKTAKYQLKFRSNRLDYISNLLGTSEKKTPLTKQTWRRAFRGHVPSLKEIELHCKQDILVLEEVYLRFRPYVKSHPNMAKLDGKNGCPACSSEHVQRRGYCATATGVKRRIQCQDCEHWFSVAYKSELGK